jgi:zinc protease
VIKLSGIKKYFLIIFILILINQSYIMCKQNITEHTLSNGLTVFLVNDPNASLVSVRTFIRAGSIEEGDYLGSGISHYLEHIVAGGTTAKRTEDEYKTAISMIGGAFNAYTTTDHTCYYINTVSKDIYEAVNLLYEWMFFCTFDKKEFNRERKVIIKEIEKNNASISRQFYQLCQTNFYKYNPIRLPVIGYLENFKALKDADLINYYKERYVPSNMVLVIGGNFDDEKVFQQVKNTFGSIPEYAPPSSTIFNEPPPFSTRLSEKEGETNVTHFSIRFASIDLFSPDLYSLDLLEFVLGNGEESLLYKKLVEEKKLAYDISCSSFTPSETTGFFDISMEIDYENLEAAKTEVFKIIDDIKNGNLKANFIERAKKQKLAEDILSITTIEDKVSRIGQSYIYANTPDFYDHYVKSFKKITKNNVVNVAKEYLNFDRVVLTVLKPKEKEKNIANNKDNKNSFQNKPKIINLDNGIRVLLYEERSLPRTYAKVFVLGGLRAETIEKNGIGHLTAELLGKGSEKYSKEDIQIKIEDNGAHLSASLGNNTLYYSLDCLSDDINELLPILFHSFLKPKFHKDDLDEIKRKTFQWIKQRKDDWYGYCKYQFNKMFFESHPNSLSPIGELDTVKAISLKDIYDYYNKLINTNSMVVSIYGDFDEKKVLDIINSNFKDLQKNTQASEFLKPLKRKLHNQSTEQDFSIAQDVGAVFVAFDAETFHRVFEGLQLDLLDSVLSGMSYPGGRLHNILRGKGLVYVVHGINLSGLEKGYYLIYALTSKDNIEKVKNIILEEIEEVKNKPISDKEFQQALAQLNFYYKDRIASIDSLSIVSSADELYNRGFDHYTKIDRYIKLLTKDSIQKTAKQYLKYPQIYIFK